MLPLFLITEEGNLQLFTTDGKTKTQPGQTLISLVSPQAVKAESAAKPAPDKTPVKNGA